VLCGEGGDCTAHMSSYGISLIFHHCGFISAMCVCAYVRVRVGMSSASAAHTHDHVCTLNANT
jgi:hypothetical protein